MGLMSKFVVLAGAYGAWDWLAGASGIDQDQADVLSALEADEECEIGDSSCAFSALQRRATISEEEVEGEGEGEGERELDESSTRRRKSKTKDLTKAWEQKIYAWIVYIHKNVSLLDWKMFYMKMDMNSTNNTIFHVHGLKGVNGTRVNWKKHPDTWVPTFALAQQKAEKLPSLAELSAEILLEDAEEEQADAAVDSGSRRRGGSLKGVPPRTAKMQKLMSAEQTRLNNMWHEITMSKRRLNWLGNYMGSHRRLYHNRPVLVQKAEAMAHEEILESSRWSDDESWSGSKPEPQVELVNQIQMCLNQTADLWVQLGRLGGMVEAMKHRVRRYRHGKPVNLLEEDDSIEQSWSHGGYDGIVDDAPPMGALSDFEDEAVVDEETSLVELDASWFGSKLFGTKEKCCVCKSKGFGKKALTGWSASGKCTLCDGKIKKTNSVSTGCTVKGSGFKGSRTCAKMCQQKK